MQIATFYFRTLNRIGQLPELTDFTLGNRLAYLNIKFQKRKGKLRNYTNAVNTKAQIDIVFINKKWNDSTSNCVAYSSFKGVPPINELSRIGKNTTELTKESGTNNNRTL